MTLVMITAVGTQGNINGMKGQILNKTLKNKKSPVLKMKNPVIKPFYGNINDDEENTYFMYGTYSQILRVQ